MATKSNALKTTPAEDKISRTNTVARAIIGAEDDARRQKTERLRKARLAKEARDAADAEPEAKPAKPAAKRVRRIKV
ncbi:MAG: hypothetical protein ACFE0P_12020 [Oceanicaulis sp.]